MAVPVITKLLVANRGEIARRVFRSCRELGIATVAVFSDADADAWHTHDADEAVRLPGSSPGQTYLDAKLVIEAARRTGADAVHPGYGFLSENADFARACADAGLVFVGPGPDAISAMGSKLAAKRLMADAGVPVLPGGDATGLDDGELSALATRIGYPVLVKASAGGGGRGMRVVGTQAELAEAVASAAREASSAFGDGTVFLERYVQRPRHVEIQVMADTHGNVVSLFERDCSVQRRHQKVIEEAPSPVVDEALRARMSTAAVAAASAVGYVGAGTVEFVVDSAGEFAFLEMNTRLQVEHPVTELVTGLDLVRLQLLVAMGHPLPPEALAPTLSGHAVQARLYAEDPTRDYLPRTGTLHKLRMPELAGLRLDSAVRDGSEVSHHYDPMLAKVIAWAPSRAEALAKLAAALAGAQIHGLVTNRELLVRVLRHPEFVAGQADTGFLERHDPGQLGAPLAGPDTERLHAAAAALALSSARRARATVQPTLPPGWRNNPSQPQRLVWQSLAGTEVEVGYLQRASGVELEVDGKSLGEVNLISHGADGVDLELDGVRRQVRVSLTGDPDGLLDDLVAYVDSAGGASTFTLRPRFVDPSTIAAPGSLAAPMPGSVVRVNVAAGSSVRAGEALVVLEAMKMEHTVSSPIDGEVSELAVRPGDQVATGDVLVVVAAPQQNEDG
ncbi:MAG: ATP-binding protein [Pseudonocardia sp.]